MTTTGAARSRWILSAGLGGAPRTRRLLRGTVRFQQAVATLCLLGLALNQARSDTQYWNGAGTWTAANTWGVVSGGPYFSTWTNGNVAQFDVPASTITYVTTTPVGGIVANENVTVTPAGTFTTGNTVIPISVASGKTFNLQGQNISTAGGTGINKSGPGVLFSANANNFPGGFTLTDGYMIISTSGNVLGAGALNLNGGALGIGGAANISFSSLKFTSINIGDFQLGVLNSTVPLASDSLTITFNGVASLGAATRTITIGGNSTYTLAGVISGSGSAGLTVDRLGGATGVLVLQSAHTYPGNTTINGGILRVGTGGHAIPNGPTYGDVIVGASGTLDVFNSEMINGLSGAGTINNSSGSSRDLTVGDNDGGGTFSGVIQNTGGPLSLIKTNGTGTITLSGTTSTYTGKTSVQGGVLEIASLANVSGGASSLGAPTSTANGAIPLGEFATSATLRYIGTGNSTSNRRIDMNGITGGATLDVANSGNLTLSTTLGIPVNGAKTLTLTGSSSGIGTISGVISNSANGNTAVTKSGTGTWVLSGANTYSNDTTISAGTLQLGAAGVLPNGPGFGNVSVTGTLDLNTFSETINGLSGGGVVDTVAGGTPTLTVGDADQTSTFSGSLQNSAGTLALTKTGAGTLTLSGASTHGGNTTVSAGTLNLSHSLALQASTVASGGTGIVFDQSVGSHAFTFGGLSGATDLVLEDNAGSPNAVALTVGANDAGTTYSGILSGDGSLTKTGTGTLSLSGANAYTGATAIEDGAIAIVSVANRLPIGTTLTLGAGADSGKLILGNGVTERNQELAGLTTSGSGLANAVVGGGGANATLTLNIASGTSSFGGLIGGVGANENRVALTKIGAGTMVLSGMNTYDGATAISAGTLRLGASGVIPDGASKGNVTLGGGATLDLGGYSETINGLSSSGTIDNTLGAGTYTLSVGANDQTSSFSGLIQNTSGTIALTKVGTGVLTLAGTHTYSGDTTVSAGSLTIGAGGHTIPNGAGKGNVSIAGSASLNIVQSEIINGLSGAGTIDNTSGSSRTLTIGDNDAGGTFSGLIQNTTPLALIKIGSGTIILSGTTSTYTGQTAVHGGVLEIASLANTSSISSLGAPTSVGNGAIPIGSGATAATLRHSGAANSTSNRRIDINGTSGGATLDVSGTGDLTFTGTVSVPTAGAKTLTLTGSSSGIGTIPAIPDSGAGAISLTKSGSGTWVLSGANTYSGNTTISLGTLRQGVANAVPGGAGKGNVAVTGTLDLNGLGAVINGLSGNGTVDGTSGSPTLSVGNNDQTSSFGGVITDTAGTLAVTKAGTGTLTLGGVNTYSGNTTVNAGILRVNGSIATSPLTTVAAGAVLGGTGIVGPLTVEGAVAPGASVGTLDAGDTIWAPDGEYIWEINDFAGTYGTDPGWDKLDITGDLDINATVGNEFVIRITSLLGGSPGDADNFNNATPYTISIATVSGAINGFAANKFILDATDFDNATGGGSWTIEQNGSTIDVVFTPVSGIPLPPVATAASSIAAGSFFANWNASAGAVDYRLDVFRANDDFTDDDISDWAGDTASYSVLTAGTLPSGNATTDGHFLGSSASASSSALYIPSTETSEWFFSLGTPNWDPSNLNYLMVVLMASTTFSGDIPANNFVGYYLRIGDAGTDPIRLIRKTGAGTSEVGTFGDVTAPSFSTGAFRDGLNIRVTRSNAGVFSLYYSTGFQYTNATETFIGDLTNNVVTTSSYFGLGTHLGGAAADRRVYLDNLSFGSDKDYVTGFQDLTVVPTTRQVTGLDAGAQYFYDVRAVNGFGTSSNSNAIGVYTLSASPVATAATDLQFYSFIANWNALSGATGYALDVLELTDDFFDVNFTAYPTWQGDTADYEVLTAGTVPNGLAATDGAFLASKSTAQNKLLLVPSTEVSVWRFSLASPDFAPSDNNHIGVLLMSSAAISGDLPAANFTGYYLRVGTDATDGVRLYRSGGVSKTLVGEFTTPDFGVNGLRSGLNIKVTRDGSGNFELFYESGFGGTLSPTNSGGILTDNNYNTSAYFGVWLHNSSGPSASRRVYLDNVMLGDNFVAGYNDKPVAGTSDTVSGLNFGRDYMYQVRADLETGTSPDSNTISVRTPSPPTIIQFK